ncbi:Trm112 family protein [Vulgatibacter incomptus]|nr:Trm112 family protein [Vulgatibacter incomptus]
MALNVSELEELLACPKCKGDLEIHESIDEIHCRACRLIFPIRDGLPVMLVDEAAPLPADRRS